MIKRDPESNVFGKSPLGGNSVEGTTVEGVQLFWDARVQAYISEQAIDELDDRDLSLERSREYQKEKEFRQKAGIREG